MNTHFIALLRFGMYEVDILLHRSTLKLSAKNRIGFLAFVRNFVILKLCVLTLKHVYKFAQISMTSHRDFNNAKIYLRFQEFMTQ